MKNRIYLCLAHMSGREMDYIKEQIEKDKVFEQTKDKAQQ